MTKRDANLLRKEAARQTARADAYRWQADNASDAERSAAFRELAADAAEIAKRMLEGVAA